MKHTSFSANLSPRARAFAVSVLIAGVVMLAVVTLARVTPPAVDERLVAAEKLLAQARDTGTVPYDGLAAEWVVPDVEQTQAQKTIFMAHMLPLIARENQRIREQRASLQKDPSPSHINALAKAYGLEGDRINLQTLLVRVDVLPVSLVLAQAALESGWGTSRFAQEGHAYFGERTYDEDAPGIEPKRAEGFKVKAFDNAALSVRSYMRTLNTHRAYRALRLKRAAMGVQSPKISSSKSTSVTAPG